jgi:hypothetical protein
MDMRMTYRRIRLRARSRVRLLAITASAVLALVGGIAPPGVTTVLAHSRAVETVATGLDNPRGLVLLDEDKLAVAEAGHAGPLCLAPGYCLGLNGQVTALGLRERDRTVLASGLLSFSGPFGAFGLGGVTLRDGKLYFVVGLNPQSFGDHAIDCQGQADYNSCVTVATAQRQSGFLNRVESLHSNRGWHNVAGVGRFDFDYAVAHPDPGNPEYIPGDANPFGLIAGPSGGFYVVDAASNTLDFVSNGGDIKVLAFIPDPPNHQPIYDAAPTCAARTPNGDLYIGTESNSLWRWDGHALTKVLSGGKIGQVIGCVADRHGNIYLANLASKIGGTFPNFNEKPFDGSIVKVTPRLTTSYVATGLNYPTGLTLGEDGALYVAVNGLCPKDLSLLNSDNSPPGACPEPGKVVRLDRDEND